jgi:alkylation response protein AidB-like acyl-CoA dehydrogenase
MLRLAAERLGAIAVRLHAARLLFHRRAMDPPRKGVRPADGAMVKLLLSETWTWCTREQIALRALLGAGEDPELENDLCDAVAGRIYSGTSEIQRDIVGQAMKL